MPDEFVSGQDPVEDDDGLLWRLGRALSALPGVEARICSVARCHCDSEAFQIFRVHGQEHEHYQCTRCGWVYCKGSVCEAEAAEDEQLKREDRQQ